MKKSWENMRDYEKSEWMEEYIIEGDNISEDVLDAIRQAVYPFIKDLSSKEYDAAWEEVLETLIEGTERGYAEDIYDDCNSEYLYQ